MFDLRTYITSDASLHPISSMTQQLFLVKLVLRQGMQGSFISVCQQSGKQRECTKL